VIAKLVGPLDAIKDDYVVIETHGIYYQVMVPSGLIARLKERKKNEEDVTLYTIYYIESGVGVGNQVPRLVGFTREIDKEFFERYITVKGLGEKKALKSLTLPINRIALAIERGDKNSLMMLPGIGPRLADQIIAELRGKVSRFALLQEGEPLAVSKPISLNIEEETMKVLVEQLGYRHKEAGEIIRSVLSTEKQISSTEELISAIFSQQSKAIK